MDKKVKEFVKEYNNHIKWNKEILKEAEITEKDYQQNAFLREIVEEYLAQEGITKTNYDLDESTVYSYDTGTQELQTYSFKSYHRVYFWCTPVLKEEEYKKERLKLINDKIRYHKEELRRMIDSFEKDKMQTINFSEKLNYDAER